jgi:hypothetical protein
LLKPPTGSGLPSTTRTRGGGPSAARIASNTPANSSQNDGRRVRRLSVAGDGSDSHGSASAPPQFSARHAQLSGRSCSAAHNTTSRITPSE